MMIAGGSRGSDMNAVQKEREWKMDGKIAGSFCCYYVFGDGENLSYIKTPVIGTFNFI